MRAVFCAGVDLVPPMKISLPSYAEKLVEAGCLSTLIVSPIFFNPNSMRIFEEDKIPLLRSIAILIALGLLIRHWENRRAHGSSREQFWRLPLIRPALLWGGVYVAATIFSIAPRVSFWGAYVRQQGLYTWLSYIVVFLGTALVLRSPMQMDRVVTTIVLTSIPPSLYGVLQYSGRDPFPWALGFDERIFSTAGNPIFAAAWLVLIIPVTLAKVLQSSAAVLGGSSDGKSATGQTIEAVLAGGYLFLLCFQVMIVVLTNSRGPLLGLGAGITVFLLTLAARLHRRTMKRLVAGLALAAALFLWLLNLPDGPLASLRNTPYLDRLARISEVGDSSARPIIWEGATRLLAAEPSRSLFGYGPDTVFEAYTRFHPVELHRIHPGAWSVDRSHNVIFDDWIMTGVFGCAIHLGFLVLVVLAALRGLGLIPRRGIFLSILASGAVVGALVAALADGSFRFAPLGLAAGSCLAFGIFLTVGTRAPRAKRQRTLTHQEWLWIAMISAVVGNFIEGQFGIATATTWLYFWVYAGLAASLTRLQRNHSAETPVANATTAESRWAEPSGLTLRVLSLGVALIGIILTFIFRSSVAAERESYPALIYLLGVLWPLGALILVGSELQTGKCRRVAAGLGVYGAWSLVPCATFFALHSWWLQRSSWTTAGTPEMALQLASRQANVISILYASVLLIVIGMAAAMATVESSESTKHVPRSALGQTAFRRFLYGVLWVVSAFAILRSNLNFSRADIHSKIGSVLEKENQWALAQIQYDHARRLRSDVIPYAAGSSRTRMEQAKIENQLEKPHRYVEQAIEILEHNLSRHPCNLDAVRNLARTHRTAALLSVEPNARTQHFDDAGRYLSYAVQLSPDRPELWNGWAAIELDRGRVATASAKLDRSLQLDDEFIETYLLRARVHLDQRDYRQALNDYERALRIQPNSAAALRGKSLVLGRLQK